MALYGFEKISTNCDILIQIYKMLNLEDQLRLTQVSSALKSFYENFIWNYRMLTIYDTDPNYVVTNETNVNRELLSSEGLQDFLRRYADRVQELTTDTPFDVKQFQNLTGLRCHGDFFGLEFMQFVAEKLPRLEKFHPICSQHIDIEHSLAHTKGVVLVHEDSVLDAANIESLVTMRHLKELRLDYGYSHPHCSMKYQHFCDILYNMQLEVLKLSFEIKPDGETGHTASAKPLVSLKELDITVSFDPQKWSSNFTSFLQLFANLSILTLQIPHEDKVPDETLDTISKSCRNLEKLTMRYIYFTSIKSFVVPPKVIELHMERCHGLTCQNLRQILTESGITEFVSQDTDFEGVIEDFRISPLIQTLAIDTVDMAKLPSAYAGNDKLKNLTWHYQGDGFASSPNIVSGVPLASCHNLESLIARDCHVTTDTLLKLKHLRKLTTCLKLPTEWCDITALLRHPSLLELAISVTKMEDLTSNTVQSPAEGFPTNVTNLKLLYSASFANDLDFWLSLFCQNAEMQLTIYNIFLAKKDIWSLITHKKFPTSLRTIDIYGFTLNCNDLRRNFDVIMEKLRHVRFLYGVDDHVDRMNKFGIILCRK